MTKAQQRVAIAKDALKHLRARRFKMTSGDFMKFPSDDGLKMHGDINEQVAKILPQMKCEVCGIGGMFYSGVMRNDELTVSQCGAHPEYSAMAEYLSRWFNREQLQQIEIAFERGRGWFRAKGDNLGMGHAPKPIYESAKNFGKKFRSNVARFTAICRNIIRNKGTFVPK